MGIKKRILYCVLKFLSIFLSFVKQRNNRITFISLTEDHLEGDFLLIANELRKNHKDIEIKTVLTKFKPNIIGNFLYFFNCIEQLFVISSSKVVFINDNNYVISNFKCQNVKVIQIWHACGALKKFGNEIKREYPIKNYDYIISTSDVWKPVYAKSFGVLENQVLSLGMARTDALCRPKEIEKSKLAFFEHYPHLKNKYIILYAPTFRGNIIKGFSYVDLQVDQILKQLPDECVILYKMHPLLGDVVLGHSPRCMDMNDENLYTLMAVSDCLVSDYSSIVLDYSLLGKKMVLYVPDYNEYNDEIGVNLNLSEIPGEICYSEVELIEELKQRETEFSDEMLSFKHKFFKYTDGNSAFRISEFAYSIVLK